MSDEHFRVHKTCGVLDISFYMLSQMTVTVMLKTYVTSL